MAEMKNWQPKSKATQTGMVEPLFNGNFQGYSLKRSFSANSQQPKTLYSRKFQIVKKKCHL
jgi:hypothetical protein